MARRLDPIVQSSELYAYGWPQGLPITRMAFDAVARRIFDRYRQGWPVDTGLSKRGLGYRIIGNENIGWIMVFFDRFNYAVWVERRWYPFDERRAPLIRAAVRELRADLDLGGLLRRTPVQDRGLLDLFLNQFLRRLTDREAA